MQHETQKCNEMSDGLESDLRQVYSPFFAFSLY